MWYGNFIVFVIFVVVDETISGKVCEETCQGPCNCNLVSQHDMVYFGACIGAVKYHLSLRALCTKRNSPFLYVP
jgi:hypothetical protein